MSRAVEHGARKRLAEHGFASPRRFAEHGFTSPRRFAEHGFTSPRRFAEHGFTSLRRFAEHSFASLRRFAEHGFASLRCFAEHGFAPVRRSAEHGFTLVELMVVIAIIGLLAGAVVLAMPDPRGDLRDQAERFAARVRAAQDAAVIEAHEMALWVTADGYGFERRERRGWRRLDERPFDDRDWEGAQAIVGDAGRARVIFDTTGLSEPLDLALVRNGTRVTVHIDADGTIDVGS